MTAEDPMLAMLEWLCDQLMEVEFSAKLGAEKHERSENRSEYRAGFRPRRFDTRMGTIYLMVPKPRRGGYIPFFITEKKRSEAALMNVIQEAFINGVSTRKIERLAKSLGIHSISRSQVSEITKEHNAQVESLAIGDWMLFTRSFGWTPCMKRSGITDTYGTWRFMWFAGCAWTEHGIFWLWNPCMKSLKPVTSICSTH